MLIVSLIAGSILTSGAQQSVVADSKALSHSGWSAFFPLIEGCEAKVSPILNDQQGKVVQVATYTIAAPKPDSTGNTIIGKPLTGFSWLDTDECGWIRIMMSLPYSPPKPVLSRRELKAAKKHEREEREIQKKLAKIYKISKSIYPSAPPPRAINIKGYEAYQVYAPPCDYILCENYYWTTITVKFASDKHLTIRLLGNFERASQIAESIDFEKLDSAMDMYAESVRKK